MTEETYLGDGLYASWNGWQINGWQIKLRAIDHEVYLDDHVFKALVQFVAMTRKETK